MLAESNCLCSCDVLRYRASDIACFARKAKLASEPRQRVRQWCLCAANTSAEDIERAKEDEENETFRT